jgi:hypothetical protein
MELATSSGDGQFLPKHVKVNFYVLLNLLKLMDLTTRFCIKKHNC